MNTQVTRPGHMLPEWKQGELQPYGGHVWYEVQPDVGPDAEERIGRWLERIGWLCGGMCLGCLAIWAGITF